MPEHPNARLVRSFFVAQAANDLDALIVELHPDIAWNLPRGGTRLNSDPTVVGLSALGEMSGRNWEASNGTFRFDIQAVFAGDEFAVALSNNTASTEARSLDITMAIQFLILDGQIVEVWESPDDIDAFYDFWRPYGWIWR